jgi:hypothetical protein
MPLVHVVLVLVVVGVLLWLVNSYIPMAGSIKSILNAVVVIAVVLWLLSVFGLMAELSNCLVTAPDDVICCLARCQYDSYDELKEDNMPYQPYLAPVVALIAGILILIQPGLLSIIVAVYLIAIGILGLMGARPTGFWRR